jgi:hypothetical protein
VICDREPCNVIKAQCHTSFAKRQSDCASLSVFVSSRKLMLTLVAEGQRQPAALRGQEIGLELVINGPRRPLACLSGTFVTPNDLCSEGLEQVRCCRRHHHSKTKVLTLYRDNAPRAASANRRASRSPWPASSTMCLATIRVPFILAGLKASRQSRNAPVESEEDDTPNVVAESHLQPRGPPPVEPAGLEAGSADRGGRGSREPAKAAEIESEDDDVAFRVKAPHPQPGDDPLPAGQADLVGSRKLNLVPVRRAYLVNPADFVNRT